MSSWERKINRERDRQQQRAPMLALYRPDRFESQTEAALAASRASGCVCDPDISADGINVTVSHDDWCPLIRSRQDRN